MTVNWDAATDGAESGIASCTSLRILDARVSWNMIHALQELRDKQWDVIDDSSLCYETISEIEPTYDNQWDYEWPIELM